MEDRKGETWSTMHAFDTFTPETDDPAVGLLSKLVELVTVQSRKFSSMACPRS